MNEFKTLEELKKEFGKNYDINLYKMGISAMKEIARLNKIIDDLREYMLDIDYKMGWQYAEYLDELLGIKSDYKKYGIATDLKEEGK